MRLRQNRRSPDRTPRPVYLFEKLPDVGPQRLPRLPLLVRQAVQSRRAKRVEIAVVQERPHLVLRLGARLPGLFGEGLTIVVHVLAQAFAGLAAAGAALGVGELVVALAGGGLGGAAGQVSQVRRAALGPA